MKWLPLVLTFALLPGCSPTGNQDRQPGTPKPPVADQSTPDKTVESFWAHQAYVDRVLFDRIVEQIVKPCYLFAARTCEAIQQERRDKPESKSNNRIQKVDIQSETRAVVWTLDKSSRTSQFLLTKEQGLWVVDDILYSCSFCDGTGQADDIKNWRNFQRPAPKKKCAFCSGTGWVSTYFYEKPPSDD